MKKKQIIKKVTPVETLRSWLTTRIKNSFNVAESGQSGAELLRAISAPDSALKLLSSLEQMPAHAENDTVHQLDTKESVLDCEFGLKLCVDGLVPDLEGREKKRKRGIGQFYTPEALAVRIAHLIDNAAQKKILDPACGDGSFLLAMAGKMAEESGFSSQFLNQLHGFDIDAVALFVCLVRLVTAFPGCGWPVLQNQDFLMSTADRSFDLVIGNPPYRVNLEPEFKRRLHDLYQTAEGEKDLYTFFIEAGINSLRANGTLAMLTSHTFLVNHQCQKIRNLVFAQNQVETILMLPERFFPMAPGVLPVVTILKRHAPPPGSQLTVETDYEEAIGWKKQFSVLSESFLDGRGLRLAIVPENLAAVFEGITSNCERLGDRCKIGVGIQESQRRGGVISRFVSDKRDSAQHRPVLRGRELSPFAVNWEGKYIDYGPHLAFAGNEKVFLAPKVLYQNIRNEKLRQRLVAAYDSRGFFPKNSLSYVVPEQEALTGDFICGIMNSSLVNAWFSGNFHSFHITVTQVRQIPLPAYTRTEWETVATLARSLTSLNLGAKAREQHLQLINNAVCNCYLGVGDHSRLLAMCDNFLDQAARL